MRRLLATVALSLSLLAGVGAALPAAAQDADPTAAAMVGPSSNEATIRIALPGEGERAQADSAMRILVLFTVLSIAPGLLISITSFTRIVVVLSFVRQAMGAQGAPPTQVLLSLSLLLTAVVMAPIATRIHDRALGPYLDEHLEAGEAYTIASGEIRTFLLRQTREDDLLLFYDVSHTARPEVAEDVSLHLLVPAFMISELRTAFEMGFLVFLPFILVDLLCATLLSAMGMMMMPPTVLSTPLKLLLFVLVDGWALLVRSLVASFG